MWQKIVLTAGTDSQNQIFQEQLARITTNKFSETVEIVTDEPPDIRIGSGGATLSIIRKAFENGLDEKLDKSKMLLLHSGGLSQRMPHLSAYGKAFGTLPNRKTILETKLDIYRNDLLEKLPETGGIMITASDVIENTDKAKKVNSEMDIVIFAHVSSIEVGTQHGVFVIDKTSNKLKRVLQKPTVNEMRKEGAVREDGTVLTDSCYFISWKFCKLLMENKLLRGPIREELCCYGDFMRPMGTDPNLDYIKTSSETLTAYREALADVFSTAKIEISVLGESSFFHFGTYKEYLENLLPNSEFRKAFPNVFKSNAVFSSVIGRIPNSSFVDYCTGTDIEVGENSVVSGIDAENLKIKLPSNTVIFTMALKTEKFVSVVVNIDEDIKKKWDKVKWNGHDTRIEGKSIWDAPIFDTFRTRSQSLKSTLNEWENGMEMVIKTGKQENSYKKKRF